MFGCVIQGDADEPGVQIRLSGQEADSLFLATVQFLQARDDFPDVPAARKRGAPVVLELAGVLAGAAMGAVGGLATRLRRGADGRALGRAGALAAGMWVAGVGARMAFAFAATHGAGPAIGRFSIAHHITGSDAWVAALVMMALADVLTRLAVVWLRGGRLAAAPAAAPALIPAGTRA